jgi:hypothetical protein
VLSALTLSGCRIASAMSLKTRCLMSCHGESHVAWHRRLKNPIYHLSGKRLLEERSKKKNVNFQRWSQKIDKHCILLTKICQRDNLPTKWFLIIISLFGVSCRRNLLFFHRCVHKNRSNPPRSPISNWSKTTHSDKKKQSPIHIQYIVFIFERNIVMAKINNWSFLSMYSQPLYTTTAVLNFFSHKLMS